MSRLRLLVFSILCLVHSSSYGYHANKVWLEHHQDGTFHVVINYTIPELKELRQSSVIFYNKQQANRFFWDIARGADFNPSVPLQVKFVKPKLVPNPW